MTLDWFRQVCLSFPAATEQVQWENHLVFKVGGKMFAITSVDPGGNLCSFKASPEEFSDLVERPGFLPAPYLARAQWVAIQNEEAVSRPELKRLLRSAYDVVAAKLTKKVRLTLAQGTTGQGV